MASNEEAVPVATWRDYDPQAAEAAVKEQAKSAKAADKKEN